MKVVQLDGAITPVVLARSEVFPSHPEQGGVIRVDDYLQECAMQSDGKQGAKGRMEETYLNSLTSCGNILSSVVYVVIFRAFFVIQIQYLVAKFFSEFSTNTNSLLTFCYSLYALL